MGHPVTPRPRTEIRFEGGLVPPVVFLLATVAVTVGALAFADRVFGSGPTSPATTVAFYAVAYGLVASVAWALLRREGLRPADVGLSRRNVLPGVALVAAIWVVANLLGFVVAATRGGASVGLPAGATPATWLTLAVSQLVFVGPVEELAFRGYFQNKVVSLLGGGTDRARKVVGVLAATTLFVLWHVPQRLLVQGLSLGELLPSLLVLMVYGLLFGAIYELTRNVVLAGVLHGTFNFAPILVASADGTPVGEVMLFVLPLVAVAVWGYRRWAKTARATDFRPQTRPARVVADGRGE